MGGLPLGPSRLGGAPVHWVCLSLGSIPFWSRGVDGSDWGLLWRWCSELPSDVGGGHRAGLSLPTSPRGESCPLGVTHTTGEQRPLLEAMVERACPVNQICLLGAPKPPFWVFFPLQCHPPIPPDRPLGFHSLRCVRH